MSVNVYFVSGQIPTIVATIVAKRFNEGGVNILINEHPEQNVMLSKKKDWLKIYYSIQGIISAYFMWTEVVEIPFQVNTHYIKKNPIKTIKHMRYFKNMDNRFNQLILDYNKIDNLFMSGNSQLWPHLYGHSTNSTFIEHGMGDYSKLYYDFKKETWIKLLTRKLLNSLIGYPYLARPTKVIYTDRGLSKATKQFQEKGSQIKLLSLDIRTDILNIYNWFVKEFKIIYVEAYYEIMKIKERLKNYETTYLYLPDESVTLNNYTLFLLEQLKNINHNKTCFVIKNHPEDNSDYSTIFKSLGLNYVLFSNKENSYLPAEFLMKMLGNVTLVGSNSSSCLYSKWWFEKESIVSDPTKGELYKNYIMVE